VRLAADGGVRGARTSPVAYRRAPPMPLAATQAKKVWDTLEHRGVTFPPAYQPHGVKLLYDGKPVDLSPEEEEVRLACPALPAGRARLRAPRVTCAPPARGPGCALQVATFFAVMKDSDYATKQVFVDNFWKGFRRVLKGSNKETITVFAKCDFSNIFEWHNAEREKKKLLTSEVCEASALAPAAAALTASAPRLAGEKERQAGARQG
jgi:DNA topoisomerase-1